MYKRFMLSLGVIAALLLPFTLLSTDAHAVDALSELCSRWSTGNPDAPDVCKDYWATQGQTQVDNQVVAFLSEVVSVLLYALGIAAVIAVIVGGLLYIISGGDPAKTQKARNTIIYALIGLVVAVAAQLIITFVLDRI